MTDPEYFDLGGPFTPGELVFLESLRQHTESRLRPWCGRPDGGGIFVAVDVDAPDVALLTVGVYFDGERIRGDRVDIQTYELPDPPTGLAIHVTGPPADLAVRAVEWFEEVVNRPIVRHEWLHGAQVYASRYLFADTGEGLAQTYRDDLAPPGQGDRSIASGHVHGRGWIQTDGLGEPDRVVRVGGD